MFRTPEPSVAQKAELTPIVESPDDAIVTIDTQLLAHLHQGLRLEVLEQLAGGVAHDFNNLLGVIGNCAAFAAAELTAGPGSDLESVSRDVDQILRAADQAAALTHQLLAFARQEVVQTRPLDLNHVVVAAEQLLRRTISDDILLTTGLAADLWPVLADAGQMEQVLVNLAVNACDAMGFGGTLAIDTANVVLDGPTDALMAGRHVRIRVSDTGTGMSAQVLQHAFEPFFTTKSNGRGSGLGLSTVYGIVGQARGAITIDSQPATGTSCTILMPITDEVVVPVEGSKPSGRTPAGETILIVEDQEALRDVTERIFTRSGYHVIAAANGTEAVRLAAEYNGDIHLLLTDVVLPTMPGKEAAQWIRQITPDIEVLFMSGHGQSALASQGRLDPDVSFIEKPFSASAVVDKVGHILDEHAERMRTVSPTAPPGRALGSPES